MKRKVIAPLQIVLTTLIVLSVVPLPLLGQSTEYIEAPSRTYKINETGAMQSLGIEVQVTPEVSKQGGIAGFLIQLTYKDPIYPASETVVFLRPDYFPASCPPSTRTKLRGPFTWHNSRGTGFAVTLRQECKDAHPGAQVPFVIASVWCSNIEGELRYISKWTSKRLFDFVATGYGKTVQTDAGRVLEIGQGIWDAYSLVSDILIVVDIVALSHGTLTAGQFIMKKVIGVVEDLAVDAAFDYLQTEYGSEVRFVHTGWDVTCRLCGTHFHLKELNNGDLVQCPKHDCPAVVRVRF